MWDCYLKRTGVDVINVVCSQVQVFQGCQIPEGSRVEGLNLATPHIHVPETGKVGQETGNQHSKVVVIKVQSFYLKKKKHKKLESVHRAQTPSQYIFQVQKLK